jgi:hypothetical protein
LDNKLIKLHYFNPGSEGAVLNASPYYTLPANPAKMQRDLACLPAWYARENDFVFIENTLNEEFDIFKSLFKLPDVVRKNDPEKDRESFSGMKVSLWGISPHSIHLFEQWSKKYGLNLDIPAWNEQYRSMISRRTAQLCLSDLLDNIPELSGSIFPAFYSDIETIENKLKESEFSMLIKAPYSSSGRGLLWVKDPIDRASKQVLQGMLNKQTEVSLEKVLNKQVDFAMLFYSNPDKSVDFKGYSLFQTDNKGNYKGNFVGSQDKIESVLFESIDKTLFEQVKQRLINYFTQEVSGIYEGCICVDMMLYKENDKILLHPCLEINFRHTMGWLAMELYRNHFAESVSGDFRIEFRKNAVELYEKHLQMKNSHPLIAEKNRYISGYLPLCPVDENTNFSAFILNT